MLNWVAGRVTNQVTHIRSTNGTGPWVYPVAGKVRHKGVRVGRQGRARHRHKAARAQGSRRSWQAGKAGGSA